jgi:hypothetical protein
MIDELFGSDAATSRRPEKGPAPGAGPIGVQWLALNVIDGEGPLSTRSTGRPTINKMETEKTIQLFVLHIKKALREYLVGMIIWLPLCSKLIAVFNSVNNVDP